LGRLKRIEIINCTQHKNQFLYHQEQYLINNAPLIADLFSGSGSTMVAAHQLKRKCYGMELDPKYCQVIVDRMRKLDPSLVIKRNGQVI